MSLEHYQIVLTEILTSAQSRKDFFQNRLVFLEAKNVDQNSKERLLVLDQNQIEESALALIRKRWGVVKSLLAIDQKASDILRPAYFEYAMNQPMKIHVFKHQYDALEFIEHHLPNSLVDNLNEHLQHRKEALRNYLISEGEPLKSKPKWKKFLKI